jgi:hypothetical protein
MNTTKGENEFSHQLAAIKTSPYRLTDREILIKIAKLSLKDGHCYMNQDKLAQQITGEQNISCSVQSLQRHLYRLEEDGVLHTQVKAGPGGVNLYKINWERLATLPPDFKPAAFRKNDTAEKRQQRIASLGNEAGTRCLNSESNCSCFYHDPFPMRIDGNADDCSNCVLPPGMLCPKHYRGGEVTDHDLTHDSKVR